MLGTTLGYYEETTLGTYGGTELGSLEGFTDVTADSKFEGLLLGYRLGLGDGLKLGTDKVTKKRIMGWGTAWHNNWIHYHLVYIMVES